MKTSRSLISKCLLVLLALQLMVAASSFSQPLNFRAHLSGDEEVPAVDTKARGQAIFQLSSDGTELHFKVIVANIYDVMGAHIHLASPGQNGPIVLSLFSDIIIPPIDSVNGILVEGTAIAEDVIGPFSGDLGDLVNAMLSGNAYVNVHTLAIPAGEIRGQID